MSDEKHGGSSPSPLVIVFGGTRVPETSPLYSQVRRLGRLLAQAGFWVGSGGYMGVMEAVSRGAAEAGGYVVGYTSDVFATLDPNPWLSEERRTPDLITRIKRMVDEGDAFVAAHGGIGTLAELTVVWNIILLDHIHGRPTRPLVLLGQEWEPVIEVFRTHTQMGSSTFQLIERASTPEEAVARIQTRLQHANMS